MIETIAYKFHKKLRDIYLKILPVTSNEKLWPEEWKEVEYKEYARSEIYYLPKDYSILGEFTEILKNRITHRKYYGKKITLKQISSLLHYSIGIKDEQFTKDWKLKRRHYPSGGGLYPVETYLHVSEGGIEKIPVGLYHYNFKLHALESIADKKIAELIGKELNLKNESATILLTAIWNRSFQKYLDFGYIPTLLEAGHIGQNIVLTAEALGLRQSPSLSFDGNKIDTLLDFDDRQTENILYAIKLGI